MMGLCVAAFVPICLVLLPSRVLRIKATNLFGHVAGKICLLVSGATFPSGIRQQMEAVGPAIFVSNHASILDVLIAIWVCPVGTCGVAKKEIVVYPFFGQLYWLSGHLRLDRQNPRKAYESLQAASELVKENNIGMWMWPEGTRSKDGRLLPLKSGFAHLALATRLPIVPVVVTGAHKGWERDTLALKTVDLGIQVLPKIDTSRWTQETLTTHILEVQNAMNNALPDDQKILVERAARAEAAAKRLALRAKKAALKAAPVVVEDVAQSLVDPVPETSA